MLDSQICFEIIFTFERIIINGLDSAVNNVHREIFKVAKTHLYDRAMSCLIALINQNNFVYTNELEGNVTLDFRALDGSNNEVRYRDVHRGAAAAAMAVAARQWQVF
ncbi:unnamed protein product [Rotaria sp. Silwood1]|nr:unnamed protein product [Rotaria sp. Silwood1]CAF1131093.1 unnamed protein product [Rotaria sp. Silwood1]CAF3449960.1 unnamed protein product [Rotaria sp. Silwood1]